MKSLKPTLREKKRYLLVSGRKENIEKAVREFLGMSGMAKASLTFIKSDKEVAIISVNRKMVDSVRAALCIWPEKMEVLRVSGTIKGLKEKTKI